MQYLTYTEEVDPHYPVCLLSSVLHQKDIEKHYLTGRGLDKEDVLVLDLHHSAVKKKTPVKEIKEYFTTEIAPVLEDFGVEYILVNDAEYYKAITKAPNTEVTIGYVMDCTLGPWKVVYVPSYRAAFYDPVKVWDKIIRGFNALESHRAGTYSDPGEGIIHFAEYPKTYQEIEAWLKKIIDMDVPVTVDIEGFSLKHYESGIGSICLTWNEHEGISFPVDYEEIEGATEAPFGRQIRNEPVRRLLRWFFENLKKKAIYHNIAFDVYVLIYQLYMKHLTDTEGLLHGMEILLNNWDCTKLITYLATNSCAGNKLGLKVQAQEFAGNYAVEEIKDITLIPLPTLLEYNLVDGLSTWYVHKKHYPTMVADEQLEIYETLFKPGTLDIIQMQLTGMPINMKRVKEVKAELTRDYNAALSRIRNNVIIQQFTYSMNERWVDWKNSKLVKKRVTLADAKEEFNPSSAPQMQELFYERLGLPILDRTKKGAPATGREALKALKNHTPDQTVKDLFDALIDFKAVEKILTSFIPAMEQAQQGIDGWHYLFGNFNLGGTVSGRLSSSKPNLQNLPASSKYAKLIKSCFQAPPGWLFVGLDFASLEDRISALTTKDPNKLKVYLDGFDGHAMRAVAYWPDQMPDIDPNDVASVNSIAEKGHKYGPFRQDSKAPTFALTYQGTYLTLMKNCGFSMEKAKAVESAFKSLYKVSVDWVQAKLDQASIDGYVTTAFGLRVRTPLLKQVVRGNKATPREAEAEGRTAGNALGQGWCLLNTRASKEFMGVVRASGYKLDIRPCAHIHDAQYMLIRDDLPVVMFTNKHLVKAVQWQDHPDIWHDEVKLGGELSIFYPTWEHEAEIPNGATEEQVFAAIDKHVVKLKEKGVLCE